MDTHNGSMLAHQHQLGSLGAWEHGEQNKEPGRDPLVSCVGVD